MQDDDKIERLKEQVHRLTAAKMELEDELALLRGGGAGQECADPDAAGTGHAIQQSGAGAGGC